ncbi:MAG: hypothetical protein AW10_03857 [Candidatus Accumulibacter appositus]|uniref:Uncharacterized protein n=1 Tax=Candidatus Accumulibacter appositus TaxID=1454003 RepID=A0A011N459_9PROT|nr:MAG: hypothetical protein AW10_03857 [Candidatus Accumulibacter appositus]
MVDDIVDLLADIVHRVAGVAAVFAVIGHAVTAAIGAQVGCAPIAAGFLPTPCGCRYRDTLRRRVATRIADGARGVGGKIKLDAYWSVYQAGIDRQVVLAGGQGDEIALACRGIHVGIVGVRGAGDARVLRGEGVTDGLVNLDRVLARPQIAEQVIALRTRRGRRNLIAVAVQQMHLHPGDAHFIVILDTVVVAVQPHLIAEASQLIDARVDVLIKFTWVETYGRGGPVKRVGVRVISAGGASSVLRGEDVISRKGERNPITRIAGKTWRQPNEFIVAGVIRSRCLDDLVVIHEAIAIKVSPKLHSDVLNTNFAAILNAVGVRVQPDRVA